MLSVQACREGGVGGKLPRTPQYLGEPRPPLLRNIKYTRMHRFEKKNSKIVLPAGLCDSVWRALRECFPRSRCGCRRAWPLPRCHWVDWLIIDWKLSNAKFWDGKLVWKNWVFTFLTRNPAVTKIPDHYTGCQWPSGSSTVDDSVYLKGRMPLPVSD